jgi:hypothetical protein
MIVWVISRPEKKYPGLENSCLVIHKMLVIQYRNGDKEIERAKNEQIQKVSERRRRRERERRRKRDHQSRREREK